MGLLVSVSGVRGIVGESFTKDVVRAWAKAFAQHCHPDQREGSHDSSAPAFAEATADRSPQNDVRIILGRDTRPSGTWALEAAAGALAAHGIEPIVVGVAPTPTIQLAVTHHRAAGGLIITASHNPSEWNGLKFLGADGAFLSAGEMEKLHQSAIASVANQHFVSSPRKRGPDSRVRGNDSSEAEIASALGPHNDNGAMDRHIENILALPIGVEEIRARKFRVVVDPVNGTGALAVPPLLERLGCTVTMINGEPNGQFAHLPEPTPANLQDLGATVREQHADLGVAVDPDADRLALVDETGTVLSEEYTVTLAILSALSSSSSQPPTSKTHTVVVNLSTTRMADDVSKQHGAKVIRTPVGERHVVEGMRQHDALIGGEGNGGVIFPKSHEGRDSLVGIALILDLLARLPADFRSFTPPTSEVGGTKLSTLVGTLPRYVMVKEKLPLGDPRQLPQLTEKIRKLAMDMPGARLSSADGVRLDTADGWVHLRPSNTEPIIRLIAEARTAAKVEKLCAPIRALLAVLRTV